jgi:hypothetical protein
VRIILDEDIPRELASRFSTGEHNAVHVEDLGWKGIKNGDLLRRISGSYDVLITGDTNMPQQQNLALFDVAIIQLRPRLKVIDQLLPLVPKALAALPIAPRHQVTVIEPD